MTPETIQKNQETIAGLKEMIAFLEDNPEIPLPTNSEEQVIHFWSFMDLAKEDFLATAKALGTFEKKVDGDKFLLMKKFGAVTLTASIDRSKVCTKTTVIKSVPVDEWECEPLMSQTEFETVGQEAAIN